MSDTFLRFTPGDPTHVPSESCRRDLMLMIDAAFPAADGVDDHEHEVVTFIDAGENFESVACPACGETLDSDWWGHAMGTAADGSFTNLSVTLPCCGAQSSLNGLRYEMPQAFARYVIEVMNPDVVDVPDTLLGELSERLGGDVRAVWTRY